jgi:hypothetical protein
VAWLAAPDGDGMGDREGIPLHSALPFFLADDDHVRELRLVTDAGDHIALRLEPTCVGAFAMLRY